MKLRFLPGGSWLTIMILCLATACSKVPEQIVQPEFQSKDTILISEPFETSEKTNYTNELLQLQSGNWIFANALLGTSASDRMAGFQSARVVATGSISMVQPVNLGTESKIVISAALYGTGTSAQWKLMASNNGGAYTQVGSTITTNSATLTQTVFNYNQSGWTSFAIQSETGGLLNFDDFSITTKTIEHPLSYIASPLYVTVFTSPSATTVAGAVGRDSLSYPVSGDNSNLLMGNPSNAVTDATNAPNNYLMENRYYTISYSRDRVTPNWVSWHLDRSNYGAAKRSDNYQPNPALPAGWYRAMSSAYSATTGYSRGHNCPSGDRTSSDEANNSVFLMTNMIPQTTSNNSGVWNNLEVYTRTLTDAGSECYVIMGSYGSKGTIDNGKITIPSNIWKVIVVLPAGNSDLSRVDGNTRVICVNTPNDASVNADWRTFRVSLKAIEDATGYSLLSAIPAAVKQALINKVDNL